MAEKRRNEEQNRGRDKDAHPSSDEMPTPSESPARHQVLLDKIRQLPQIEGEVWQADICQVPIENQSPIGGRRPWMLVVANNSVSQATERLIEALKIQQSEPAVETLWEILVDCMLRPSYGKPHRPEQIQFRSDERSVAWAADLEAIGVKRVVGNLGLLDFFVQMTAKHLDVTANADPIDQWQLSQNQ